MEPIKFLQLKEEFDSYDPLSPAGEVRQFLDRASYLRIELRIVGAESCNSPTYPLFWGCLNSELKFGNAYLIYSNCATRKCEPIAKVYWEEGEWGRLERKVVPLQGLEQMFKL